MVSRPLNVGRVVVLNDLPARSLASDVNGSSVQPLRQLFPGNASLHRAAAAAASTRARKKVRPGG